MHKVRFFRWVITIAFVVVLVAFLDILRLRGEDPCATRHCPTLNVSCQEDKDCGLIDVVMLIDECPPCVSPNVFSRRRVAANLRWYWEMRGIPGCAVSCVSPGVWKEMIRIFFERHVRAQCLKGVCSKVMVW